MIDDLKIKDLLVGKIIYFTMNEIGYLLRNLHNLHINTIMIQKTIDEEFLVKVDDLTSSYHIKEEK